jgi:transposase-like protein
MNRSKKQRKFSPEFKLNVVLEGYATGNWSATAERHGLHITQVRVWKKQLLTDGARTFLPKRKRMTTEQKKIDQLEKIIGRITIENELLKKTQEILA